MTTLKQNITPNLEIKSQVFSLHYLSTGMVSNRLKSLRGHVMEEAETEEPSGARREDNERIHSFFCEKYVFVLFSPQIVKPSGHPLKERVGNCGNFSNCYLYSMVGRWLFTMVQHNGPL